MLLGITVSFKHSVFSSGVSQTSLALAELYTFLGYTCTFINVSSDSDSGSADALWWEDIKTIQNRWACIQQHEIRKGQFDRILEIDTCHLTPSQRNTVGVPCIWIVRKSPLFRDTESCVLPYPVAKRDLIGLSETWIQEELSTQDDIQYLEVITRRPVRKVPFLWSALAVETFRTENKGLPIWQQSFTKGATYDVHICETNMSSTSSCVIPICIFKEAIEYLPSSSLKVHNADYLNESEFFRKNVWDNITAPIPDVKSAFVGRQRIVELPSIRNTLLIAHSRFITIRPYHLDALWCGIPLIHNSTLLNELGPHVARGYYHSNTISQACSAVKSITNTWINEKELYTLRRNILLRFGILSPQIQSRWKEACESATLCPAPAPVPAPIKQVLTIGFSDMWENFNPAYNFFTLLLEHTFPTYSIVGVDMVSVSASASASASAADILIFGPFGFYWKSSHLQTIPKIHYTGENTPPIERDDILLNLGYERRTTSNYIRLPLWVLEIDWFQADTTKIQNPIPISLTESTVAGLEKRNKFCAFIVSNPSQPIRNQAFHTLCRYKRVDSAGRVYNNVGNILEAGLGGGGGERKKVDFLKNYKFCLAYENESSPGYITEKIFHAKAAGCVPIYWGAPDVELDFDIEGCIDARNCTTDELLSRVKELDKNHELWLQKARIPAVSHEKKEELFSLLNTVAQRILDISKVSVLNSVAVAVTLEKPLPVSVSTTTTSISKNAVSLGNTVFVTGCNSRFIDSLLSYWLPAVFAQKNVSTNIQVHIYLLQDVTTTDRENIVSKFPSVNLFDIPSEPYGFPDCWNPQHFVWKLWLLKESVRNIQTGFPVIYMDTGVLFCKWPRQWLDSVKKEGICLLEDSEQDNRHWCNEEFCRELNVTEKELDSQQLWAGSVAFVAGNERAIKLFDDAWVQAQKRHVIVGEKWSGLFKDKKPYGHRHDQSILSILSLRQGIPRFPLESIYCHVSLRNTFLKGASLYVHRGFFAINDRVAEGIDSTWVINLNRRKDRMEKFNKNNAFMSEKVVRFPAIEGSNLQLTPSITRLFSKHAEEAKGIFWRKGVMGCALSHMSLWMKLLEDKKEIDTYLILEDDAIVSPTVIDIFHELSCKKAIPDDWDVIYLGGVLPPNREGFESAIEMVNPHVSRIKENTMFRGEPSRYFHFCAYAYIIRRSGAEKLMKMCKDMDGCWAPADHLLCNSHQILNIYFPYPLLAGCYQDNDPIYQTSAFNTFKKEEYDSDLRNDERFSVDAAAAAAAASKLDIKQALLDASSNQKAPSPTSKFPIVYNDIDGLFEKQWLEYLLGQKITDVRTEIPIVIYQRPYCEKLKATLRDWPAFTLIHLSDEKGLDPIDIYDWPACKGVVRNYIRSDIRNEKVLIIPLGYHWNASATAKQDVRKDLIWSFVGAEHINRKEKLRPFKELSPNTCIFQKEWNSPDKIGEKEVINILQRSLCVPCPGGVEQETFRIYEALEAGAIPILVEEDAPFLTFFKNWIPLAISPDWITAARVVHGLTQRPELYIEYKRSLINGWNAMKEWACKSVRERLFIKG